MTTYTFINGSTTGTINWNTASAWSPAVVPNAPDADVVIPAGTSTATSPVGANVVSLGYGQAFQIGSLSLTGDTVDIPYQTSLSVAGTLKDAGSISLVDYYLGHGALSAGTLDIAANGTLLLAHSSTVTVSGTLTNAGSIGLTGDYSGGGTITAGALDITPTGTLFGTGTINGPIVNDGTITAAMASEEAIYLGGTGLLLTGPVGGSGTLVIDQGASGGGRFAPSGFGSATLELGGATSNPVRFNDGTGILTLDNPASFTGTITPAAPLGFYFYDFVAHVNRSNTQYDQVILSGISLASVTGTNYAGDGTGGTLTINEGAVQQSLHFAGNLTAGSFVLSAGSPTSSGASSLVVSIVPPPHAPTLSLATSTGTGMANGKLIVNAVAPHVTGTTDAGTTVTVAADGTAVASTATVNAYVSTTGTYSVATAPLSVGEHVVTATASNHAGTAADPTALDLVILPDPVGGITTAPLTSHDIATVLGEGFTFQLTVGTEAVHLTNGTLSLGPDTDQAFVERLYDGLLGRTGDTAGLGGFNGALIVGATHADVANTFLTSAEYQAGHGVAVSDAQYVSSLYQGLLGRAPSQADLSGWLNPLAGGESRADVAVAFAQSGEAKLHWAADTAHVWAPDPNGALVTQIYETGLGRAPDLGGLQGFEQQLAAGTAPYQVAQAVAYSAEFNAEHAGSSSADFITSLYQAALGRTPGPAELHAWVDQLDAGAGSAFVLYQVASSAEATAHLSPIL